MRRNGRAISTPISRKRRGQRALDDLEDQLGPREGHLEVDLGELELAIGAQRLVAEAAGDLHVASKPAIIRICLKICGDCGSA